jgi:hypothetical protein
MAPQPGTSISSIPAIGRPRSGRGLDAHHLPGGTAREPILDLDHHTPAHELPA